MPNKKNMTTLNCTAEFEAITWWTSFTPAEMIELRDKYAYGFAIIDMPKKVIVNIWEQAIKNTTA